MAILLAVTVVFSIGEILLRVKVKYRCSYDSSKTGIQVKNLDKLFCMVPDPYIGYQMPEDLDVILVGERFKTNSIGFRTPEIKKKNKTRVLAIGDSVLSGWGVPENGDYPRLLELKINKMGKDVEFINMGVPGYNTIQEALLLEKWFDYVNPDFVLIHYTANDWEEINNGKRVPQFSSPSYLLNYLVLNIQKLTKVLPGDQRIEIVPHTFEQDVPEHLAQAYERISKYLQKKQTPSLVVLGSRFESPIAPHFGVQNILSTYGFNSIDLMQIMRGKHVGVPQLNYQIKDRHNNELIIPGDGHPNKKWHEEVSEILLPILLRELF